jgi:hypothetical protein
MQQDNRKISLETVSLLGRIEKALRRPKACSGFDRWLTETIKEIKKTESLDLLERNIINILRVLKEYSKIEMVIEKSTAEKFYQLHEEMFSLFTHNMFSKN